MSPLLSGNCCAIDALFTGTGIQRDLKLQLGFCKKKTRVLSVFKRTAILRKTIFEGKKFKVRTG